MCDLVCDVIDNDDSVSPSVVAGGDGPKPLLPCCIPLCVHEWREIETSVGLKIYRSYVEGVVTLTCYGLVASTCKTS